MTVKPVLDDWPIPRIQAIRTLEHRDFVELPIPGRVGSLFQDMNSSPTRIAIAGSLYGDEARNQFFEQLRGKFQAGQPVTFVADIVNATEVQYVIVEDLRVQQSGRLPDQLDYYVALRESPPPPPPPDPLGGIDTGLLDQAAGFMDTINGALDIIDTLGSVPDLGDPTPPLTGALGDLTAATAGLDGALAPLTDIFGSED